MTELTVATAMRLKQLLQSLATDEEGQDIAEYGLLAALISVAAVATIVLVGPKVVVLFQNVVNTLP